MNFYLGNRAIINLEEIRNIDMQYLPGDKLWGLYAYWKDGENSNFSLHSTPESCHNELEVVYIKMRTNNG